MTAISFLYTLSLHDYWFKTQTLKEYSERFYASIGELKNCLASYFLNKNTCQLHAIKYAKEIH